MMMMCQMYYLLCYSDYLRVSLVNLVCRRKYQEEIINIIEDIWSVRSRIDHHRMMRGERNGKYAMAHCREVARKSQEIA